jgi:hypothetical protein
MIHIEQNLGDRADVHHRFEEAQDSREGAAPRTMATVRIVSSVTSVIPASTINKNVTNTVVVIGGYLAFAGLRSMTSRNKTLTSGCISPLA